MRVQVLGFRDGRAVLVGETPQAVVGAGLELFARRGGVGSGLRECVFGDGQWEARACAADGGDAAGFVLVAFFGAGAGLGGGSGGEGGGGGAARGLGLRCSCGEADGLQCGREEERWEEL